MTLSWPSLLLLQSIDDGTAPGGGMEGIRTLFLVGWVVAVLLWVVWFIIQAAIYKRCDGRRCDKVLTEGSYQTVPCPCCGRHRRYCSFCIEEFIPETCEYDA